MKKTTVKMTNKKINQKVIGKLRHIVLIMIFDLIIATLICGFLYLSDADIHSNYPLIMVGLGFSCFITAYYTGYKIRKNGLVFGILYNLPFVLFLVIFALIINSFVFDIRLLITVTIMLLSSAVGGVTAVNTKRKQKR